MMKLLLLRLKLFALIHQLADSADIETLFLKLISRFNPILIQSDDEDDEYIDELDSDEEPEECEEIEIESEEVADNVINSNYLVRHELLKKSGKVLRDGKELPAEFDDLAVRIESILKQ
jgi:hypothetical protein